MSCAGTLHRWCREHRALPLEERLNRSVVLKSRDLSAPLGLCVCPQRGSLWSDLLPRTPHCALECDWSGGNFRRVWCYGAAGPEGLCSLTDIIQPLSECLFPQVQWPPHRFWLRSLTFSPFIHPSLHVSSASSFCTDKKTSCFDSCDNWLNVIFLLKRSCSEVFDLLACAFLLF